MKRIFLAVLMLATFASAQQTDSTDILVTVREDGDTLQTGRWRSGMPVRIRDSWNGWGEREKLANKFVIVRVGVEKSRIDSFLVAHSDSTTGLRRKYQLSRSAIQFVKNNRDAQNVVRVTPAQLRNAFKRANRLRRFGEPQRMGVLTPDLFVRWRNMLVAPTLTSVTVNTDGGGDYTSLVSAEAGEQDNLVTANEQITFNCSGTTADVAVVFNGWTTDATRLPIIQGNNDTGIWDDTKYRINSASTYTITNYVDLKMKWIQVSGGSIANFNNLASQNILIFENCLFRVSTRGIRIQTNPSNTYAINTIIYQTGGSYAYNTGDGTGNHFFYNCTIPDYSLSGANITAINTIATSFTVDSITSCLVADSVDFVDSANGDFSLALGSLGIDQGTDLSAEGVTADIKGVVRPQGAAFDVGAFEFVPTGESTIEKKNGWNGWLNKGFKGRY